MGRPRKNQLALQLKSDDYPPAIMTPTSKHIGVPQAGPWVMPKTVELGVMDEEDYFTSMKDMTVINLSRDFKRRFGVFGDSVYKEMVCALKTVLWAHLKADFPNANPVINIILPRVDLGIAITGCPEAGYLNDQRVLQERLDEACRCLALAIRA